ncbi:hypothetical protein LJB83_01650 [Clostridia bacterium OttesenSCG-928-F22]|nr:hypothetical protein [Clostridia bacterium OttesenSCG-928-F22]
MRTSVFQKIYSYLKQIAPDILAEQQQKYYLKHSFNDNVNQYIAVENSFDGLLIVGTYFTRNKSTLCDPALTIFFDNEKEMARINAYALDTMNIYVNFEAADIDEEEKSKEEKEYNDYVVQYLRELAGRVKRSKEPFFEKRYVDDNKID